MKINIAELLKDCPKGTKLYSPICGECYLGTVNDKVIEVSKPTDRAKFNVISFNKYGACDYFDAECLLFPSKEVRNWNYFRVKYAKGINAIKILTVNGGKNKAGYAEEETNTFYIRATDNNIEPFNFLHQETRDYILSTGTELKLEEPKFKVGDVVRDRTGAMGIVKDCENKHIKIEYPYSNATGFLLPSSISPVTPEEIKGWNEKGLHPKHLHYSTSKHKIIHWFLPKDDVLVRCPKQEWMLCRFSHLNKDELGTHYCACGLWFKECLPYNEKTAKLIGTNDDYKEEQR